ncbi:hypothetical protein BD779DRAFT_1787793 [Infundibulicybe gibba]|nr:hypothetical protein BD779DRAFT_1787793 [Infundibulicybe gibba]
MTLSTTAPALGNRFRPFNHIYPEACVLRSYLLTAGESGFEDLLSFGVFQPQGADAVQGLRNIAHSPHVAVRETRQVLPPNAIGLSDAFGYTDWELDKRADVVPLHFAFDKSR